jgi:pilus assembly protein CpaE
MRLAPSGKKSTGLTALLIAPARDLAEQLLEMLPESRAFQILGDLKSYPPRQTLDIRVRQLHPDVVLLDAATDLEQACELISFLAGLQPATQVVGLHRHNDAEAVVRLLRLGATEFLYAPFDVPQQEQAVTRLRRLRAPETVEEPKTGRMVLFASAKPGSGASALAAQTAFALRRRSGRRVLLMDLDLSGGSIAFYLKLHHNTSVVDAFEHAGRMDAAMWASLVAHCEGLEVLPAPEMPDFVVMEPHRLHDVLEFSRMLYEWIVVDGPAFPHRTTLLALSESDEAYMVSTAELASLHLTHRTVNLLGQLGFGKERFRVLINRSSRKDGIGTSDIGKIFNCPIHAMIPNDYFSLHRAISLGAALSSDNELGRVVDRFATKLVEAAREEKPRAGQVHEEQSV